MDMGAKESVQRRTDRVTLESNSRILAIELRYRRFGFAAIEVPNRFLDTGVRTFRSASRSASLLRSLIMLFSPSVIVVKVADHHDPRLRRGVAPIMRCIRREAKLQSVPVDRVTTEWVRNALGGSLRSKEQVAAFVAHVFPLLVWKLPPSRERKPWVTEGWNMAIFDAVAIGLAYSKDARLDTHSSEHELV